MGAGVRNGLRWMKDGLSSGRRAAVHFTTAPKDMLSIIDKLSRDTVKRTFAPPHKEIS
jgi:hypothetical protein